MEPNLDLIDHLYTMQPSAIVQLKTAILQVILLHEQIEDVCAECSDPENGMSVIYPCQTIKKLEKELR